MRNFYIILILPHLLYAMEMPVNLRLHEEPWQTALNCLAKKRLLPHEPYQDMHKVLTPRGLAYLLNYMPAEIQAMIVEKLDIHDYAFWWIVPRLLEKITLAPKQTASIELPYTNHITLNHRKNKIIGHSSEGTIFIMDLNTGNYLKQIDTPNKSCLCITINNDDSLIAAGYENGCIELIEEQTSTAYVLLGHRNWVRCVTISPNNAMIASGSDDKSVIVWNTQTKFPFLYLKGHSHYIFSVVFTKDNESLISGADTIRVWNALTGDCLHIFEHRRMFNAESIMLLNSFDLNDTILAAGSNGHIHLCNIKNKKLTTLPFTGWFIRSLNTVDSNTKLVVGNEKFLKASIEILDMKTGKSLHKISMPASTSITNFYLLDQSTMLCILENGTLLTYDFSLIKNSEKSFQRLGLRDLVMLHLIQEEIIPDGWITNDFLLDVNNKNPYQKAVALDVPPLTALLAALLKDDIVTMS